MNDEVKCNYAQCKDYYYDGEYICLNGQSKYNMKQCKQGCENEDLPMVSTQDSGES